MSKRKTIPPRMMMDCTNKERLEYARRDPMLYMVAGQRGACLVSDCGGIKCKDCMFDIDDNEAKTQFAEWIKDTL